MNVMKYDLEDRLINFAITVSEVVDLLPNTRLGNHLGGQMIRCGTSPALNYGEALAAESTNDFIHKLKLILKELRETFVCLKIIKRKPLMQEESLVDSAYVENNELISIFVKSIQTAKNNQLKSTKK
jgi:four helix bundle protein